MGHCPMANVVSCTCQKSLPLRPIRFSRYNQMAMQEEDNDKTTFTTSYGIYTYRKMTLGLCNAYITF
ncbi:hypothetical protein Mapa_004281 [Marchantia paleacea]|nr:hypothetical protein Mapa_004281 [Marchantia paleacea]